MAAYEKIINNFNKILGKAEEPDQNPLFSPASEQQFEHLKQLVGDSAKVFMDFYREYEPCHGFPMLDCYATLLDIDGIIAENTSGEPGRFLAQFGVFVFATTVGGNVICIDTNNCKDGDPTVLIASSGFCFCNDEQQYEIADVPDEVADQFENEDAILLNYPNIKKCLPKIEKSFLKFMERLSRNYYEDMEEYCDF